VSRISPLPEPADGDMERTSHLAPTHPFAPSNRSVMAPEDVFGERARQLEARVLAPFLRGHVRVALVPEALGDPERQELERSTRLEVSAPGDLAIYSAPADVWRELHNNSGASEGIRALTQVVENATLPRPYARIMGIVNVTPDSFSDGGCCLDPAAALEQGLKLIREGADILDIGGESTRPGAPPVDAETELERVLPVVRTLAAQGGVPVSIDTRKARVAHAALAAGATMVNDVSAGADPSMFDAVREHGAMLCLMHMQGTPRDMQTSPTYGDCVREVTAFLRERTSCALKAGIDASRMVLDPGIGFGKRLEDNVALIQALGELRSLGAPLLLGVSRKSFLGHLGGERQPSRRDAETSAAIALGACLGADIHRVHDVRAARQALSVAQEIQA